MGVRQTSINSFSDMNLSKTEAVRHKILEILTENHEGLTDREILEHFTFFEREMYEPRVRRHELAYGMRDSRGKFTSEPFQIVAESKYKRKCRISGKMVLVWRINELKVK